MESKKYKMPLKYMLRCEMINCQTGKTVTKEIVQYEDGTYESLGDRDIDVSLINMVSSKTALKEETE